MSSKPRQAKFMAQYDSKNRTEFSWAITLSDPISKNISTITKLTRTATTGLPDRVVPFAMNLSRDPNMSSLATASRTRLAPIKLLKEAEKVAVAIPIVTKGGQKLTPIMKM